MREFLLQEESGQGMVEYALIIGLISVVAIKALTSIGGNTNELFGKVDGALKTAKKTADEQK